MKAGIPYSCLTAGLYLFAAICPASSAAENSGNPVGHWISVDFVQYVEDFQPGKKTYQGDLYLKDVEFSPGGKTSISNTWKDQSVFDQSGQFYARFYIHTIDGVDYLFLPWLSGDVTLRGQEPWYYVLQRNPAGNLLPEETASRIREEFRNISPVGQWISVDFVERMEDFQPGKQRTGRKLHLQNFEFMPGGKTSLLFTWRDNWIMDRKAKARFYIKTIDGIDYLFLPWLSGDTARGQKPRFYVLTRAPLETIVPEQPKTRTAFKEIVSIDSVAEYDDVRWKNLSRCNSTRIAKVLWTLNFNSDTVWPDPNEFPSLKQPDKILKDAMNPGLRIRDLHARGVTGKGVNVAIIDQPLYLNHPEYAGKIVSYFDTGCQSDSSMHGPGVTSLLVGAQCGAAPDAKVYYAAAPSWKKDAAFYAKAIDWIIEQNEQLPAHEKIRVVSVSAAPSGKGSPFDSNTGQWDQACA
ncbi:MAG TPA: hypothetical protein ENN79_13895, partial [Desulfobacteraceae bacterium]|nr:hypothetical protein [Desulfobacteraceae bacterium]